MIKSSNRVLTLGMVLLAISLIVGCSASPGTTSPDPHGPQAAGASKMTQFKNNSLHTNAKIGNTVIKHGDEKKFKDQTVPFYVLLQTNPTEDWKIYVDDKKLKASKNGQTYVLYSGEPEEFILTFTSPTRNLPFSVEQPAPQADLPTADPYQIFFHIKNNTGAALNADFYPSSATNWQPVPPATLNSGVKADPGWSGTQDTCWVRYGTDAGYVKCYCDSRPHNLHCDANHFTIVDSRVTEAVRTGITTKSITYTIQ